MALRLLQKEPDCELMGCPLKPLLERRDFDRTGSLFFETLDARERQMFTDMIGPCRREKGMRPKERPASEPRRHAISVSSERGLVA